MRDSRATPRIRLDGPIGEASIRAASAELDRELWPGALPEFRWFGEKQRVIERVSSRIPAVFDRNGRWIALVFLDVHFGSGPDSTWFAPLVLEPKPTKPALVVLIDETKQLWYGSDATAHPEFQAWLFDAMINETSVAIDGGDDIRWNTSGPLPGLDNLKARLISGEQSNSSIVYGDAYIIKVMRRIVPGVNPEAELGRYLATDPDLESVPALISDWSLHAAAGESSLGIAQHFVPNARDGWNWLLDELRHSDTNPSRQAVIIDTIYDLGRETAILHQTLARATEPGIAPESITADDLTGWTRDTLILMDAVGDALANLAVGTQDPTRLQVLELTLGAWPVVGSTVVGHEASSGLKKIRLHGDFHLGQTLLQGERWQIIDFEGEPARTLEERRRHFSPMKDVAGMIRSLGYAKATIGMEERGWIDRFDALDDAFIEGYRDAITLPGLVPETEEAFRAALTPWIVDKAMYEILYELNNRPDWLIIPISSLLRTIVGGELAEAYEEPTGDEEP